MGSFADTPALIAGGTIAPNRLVVLSTSADFTGLVADTIVKKVIGVTDSSTNAFDGSNHCTVGQPISLQSGDIVLCEAGAAITRGALLEADSVGRVVTATTTATGAGVTNFAPLVALQSAGGAGEKILCMWAKNTTAYN